MFHSITDKRIVLASVGFAVLLLLILLSVSSKAPSTTSKSRPALKDWVPAGKLKNVHSISIAEAEDSNDIRDHLASSTCFVPGGADADASLSVETFLHPPPGKVSYSLADVDIVYQAKLVSRRGTVLWKGAQVTRQKMIPGPGVHLSPGMNFYNDIAPLDAKLLLLTDLGESRRSV